MDIVEQLRTWNCWSDLAPAARDKILEAADEIERLRGCISLFQRAVDVAMDWITGRRLVQNRELLSVVDQARKAAEEDTNV